MIIRKLPYILFRDYPNFGYLTDNRNFGYDTASRSCLKVGELLLSKSGSIFYSVLSDAPQDIDMVLEQLYRQYPNVAKSIIQRDALSFYKTLQSKGFVFCGDEAEYANTLIKRFSYHNKESHGFNIEEIQESESTYIDTFGKNYHLTRVHIDISSRCNENCVHCYIPSKKKNSIMTNEMFDIILDQCRGMNVLNLTISGGEPMLNPSLKEYLQKCQQYNFSVNLLSNLTVLTDDLIEIIEKNPLVSIQTSLYAMKPEIHDAITRATGSFQKTYNSIKKLYMRNIPLQINCPIMKQNRFHYKDVMKFGKSLNIEVDSDYSLYGCYDMSMNNLSCRLSIAEIEDIIMEDLNKDENRARIEESILTKPTDDNDAICPICKHSLCISNSGNVYPCEGWQSLSLGNLIESSLFDIWEKSPKTIQLRNLKYNDFPKCKLCRDKKFCSTCLILNANEDVNGNYKRVNPFMCEIARLKGREFTKYSTNK